MASPKPLPLSLNGTFYLPVISLVVLTGFTFSVILPTALSFLIPAMESAVFISLPQLWDAFLSWVTPPCLFVLLNGIIAVLTASSGMFSSSGSGFNANLLGKMENLQKQSPGDITEDTAAADTYRILPEEMENVQIRSPAALMAEIPASVPSRAVDCMPRAYEVTDTDESLEEEQEFFEDEGEEDEEEEDDADDDERSSKLSELPMQSSLSYLPKSKIYEEEEDDERSSGLSKLAMVNKSFSFAYRNEGGRCVQMQGSSEPSSPQFATPSKNGTIRRSLSVDSASLHDNQACASSSESLSDEAFRKRIDDFISKMNAQLRSEATFS